MEKLKKQLRNKKMTMGLFKKREIKKERAIR